MLFSGSFTGVHFKFRSVILFELILGEGIRSVSRFTFLQADVQLFQHRLLKKLALPHCITFVPLSKRS